MAPRPLHKITAIVNTQDHLSLRLSAEQQRAAVFQTVSGCECVKADMMAVQLEVH